MITWILVYVPFGKMARKQYIKLNIMGMSKGTTLQSEFVKVCDSKGTRKDIQSRCRKKPTKQLTPYK